MAKRKHHRPDLPAILRESLTRQAGLHESVPTVLVAVSGGADSMALLAAAVELFRKGEISLFAAHLLHHPDSDEAVHRAKLVREYCLANSVPLTVQRLGANLKGRSRSPEERMRQARYRFLEDAAQRNSCTLILTGHHADDQAETVLYRVLCGTGLRGLGGIPERRDRILRPFLSVRKAELVQYCRDQGIPFSDDPSNLDLKIPRNFIRRQLLPNVAANVNPEATAALGRLGRWAKEADEVVEAFVEKSWRESVLNFQKGKIVLDLKAILTYFKLIQKYAVHKAIELAAGREVSLSSKELDRIAEFVDNSRTGSYLVFAGGVRLIRHRDYLIVMGGEESELHYSLLVGQNQAIPELSMTAVWERPLNEPFLVGDGMAADMALGPDTNCLILRFAKEGDRFFPLGSPGTKRLFRFLTDRKVSRFDKRTTLVLEREGEIIWVVGHRIAETTRVREQSDGVWRLRLVTLVGEVRRKPFGRKSE